MIAPPKLVDVPISTRPSRNIHPAPAPAFVVRGRQAVTQPQTLVIEARAGSTERLVVGLEADGHTVSVANATPTSRIRIPRGMYDLIVLSNTASEIAEWIQRIRE